jgi:hypothetical protein
LTVSVDPTQPPDFVVYINDTPYQAGACVFRVVAGPLKVAVIRPGKPPCSQQLTVTNTGPNIVKCTL